MGEEDDKSPDRVVVDATAAAASAAATAAAVLRCEGSRPEVGPVAVVAADAEEA